MNKELKVIKPFTAFFYKDCYYNALFSVMNYFEKNIFCFLVNDLVVYQRNLESVLKATACFIPQRKDQEILAQVGIGCLEILETNDLMDQICYAIDHNMPVVGKVDCFFEPIRPDFYRKKHLDHSLLLIDFDPKQRQYTILEHDRVNSLNYRKMQLDYDEMIAAIEGYRNFFGEKGEPVAYCYYSNGSECLSVDLRSDLVNNIKRNQDILSDQDEPLNELIQTLQYYLNQMDPSIVSIAELIASISQIINVKQIELICHKKVLQLPKLSEYAEKVLKNWNFVRFSLLNVQFDGADQQERIREADNLLSEIYFLEKEKTQILFEYLSV